MTRSQRRWHLRVWIMLGVTIAVVLVAALRHRTSVPATSIPPEHVR